jgi:hypothetical protein
MKTAYEQFYALNAALQNGNEPLSDALTKFAGQFFPIGI